MRPEQSRGAVWWNLGRLAPDHVGIIFIEYIVDIVCYIHEQRVLMLYCGKETIHSETELIIY